MGTGIKENIIAWANQGGDFNAGIRLFLTYNKNVFYARNIEAKGLKKGLETLVNEFANKTKMPVRELWGRITSVTSVTSTGSVTEVTEGSVTCFDKLSNHTSTGSVTEGSVTEGSGSKEQKKKLREEFPFLGKKDCPDEMAILVNRMLSAYDFYRENREKLFEIDHNDLNLCYEKGREILDAYIVNREIWEELNYYKLHGEILGKHPIFKNRKLWEEYNGMTTMTLAGILKNNIPRKMSYYKKQIADPKRENKGEIRGLITEREAEAELIIKILTERGEMA